jgi:hypothetical protein
MTAMVPVQEVKQGTKFRISTENAPFTSISGTIIDPDIVSIGYVVNGGTLTSYTYTNGATPPDPTGSINRVGNGQYYIEIDSTTLPAGVLQYAISGKAGPSALDSTRTTARFDGQIVIDSAPFPL